MTISSGTPNVTTATGELKFGGGALNLDQSGTHEHLAFTTAINFNGTSAWSMTWWGQRSSSSLASQGRIVGTLANSDNFVWTPDNSSVVQGLRIRQTTSNQVDYGGTPGTTGRSFTAVRKMLRFGETT